MSSLSTNFIDKSTPNATDISIYSMQCSSGPNKGFFSGHLCSQNSDLFIDQNVMFIHNLFGAIFVVSNCRCLSIMNGSCGFYAHT